MKNIVLVLALIVALPACKHGKNALKAEKTGAKSEVAVAPDIAEEERAVDESKYQPLISDSLFFKMERTPCFGQCPVYSINIYQSGYAELEGRRFFDYVGTFKTRFSESEMVQIKEWANAANYWQLKHVYDAPVTDLPSTTTVLIIDKAANWVYNRMNAPDGLREFETNAEVLIKDKQWSALPAKKVIEE